MGLVNKEDIAKLHFKNNQFTEALVIYSDLVNNEKHLINEDSITRYCWCLYRIQININDSFSKERFPETNKAIKYILSHCFNNEIIYQYTVFKVLNYFSEKPHFEALKINTWLNKLNPSILSEKQLHKIIDGEICTYPSFKEKWYRLKIEVCQCLKDHEKTLSISKEALSEINNLDEESLLFFKEKLLELTDNAIYRNVESQKNIDLKTEFKQEKNSGTVFNKFSSLLNKKVRHNLFGEGLIISIERRVIEVLFANEKKVSFGIESYLEGQVLTDLGKKTLLDKMSIQEMKLYSDKKAESNEYDREAIRINSEITNNVNNNEIKFYIRLVKSYINMHQIEEALEVNNQILEMDKYNKEAINFKQLYGKGLFYRYKDKEFHGNYRDVGTPPQEATLEWLEEKAMEDVLWDEKKKERDNGFNNGEF